MLIYLPITQKHRTHMNKRKTYNQIHDFLKTFHVLLVIKMVFLIFPSAFLTVPKKEDPFKTGKIRRIYHHFLILSSLL